VPICKYLSAIFSSAPKRSPSALEVTLHHRSKRFRPLYLSVILCLNECMRWPLLSIRDVDQAEQFATTWPPSTRTRLSLVKPFGKLGSLKYNKSCSIPRVSIAGIQDWFRNTLLSNADLAGNRRIYVPSLSGTVHPHQGQWAFCHTPLSRSYERMEFLRR
jgi:hypothetical protein